MPSTAAGPVGVSRPTAEMRVLVRRDRVGVRVLGRHVNRIRPRGSEATGVIAGRLSQGMVLRALFALVVRQAAKRAAAAGSPLPHGGSADGVLGFLVCCTRRSIVQVHVAVHTRPLIPSSSSSSSHGFVASSISSVNKRSGAR